MKRWLINLVFIMIALAAGAGMFVLKYQVIEKEEELFRIHRQIANDKREIHMLKGDWASLNDPERLRALVENQTDFKAFGANQVIDSSVVPPRLVAEEGIEDETGAEGIVSETEVPAVKKENVKTPVNPVVKSKTKQEPR